MSDTYDPNAELGDLAITYNGQITPPAPAVGISQLVAANDARLAALTNVDGETAFLSKFQAMGTGAWVLAGGAALALAIMFMPTGGSRLR